jgi:xylitol oxidase
VSRTLTNWAGNVTFRPRRVHRPTSLDELRAAVTAGGRVRALGTGHSFNHIADTDGSLVSLGAMPRTVEVDRSRSRVAVAAGVRYGDLTGTLNRAGLALPNLGSLPHIAVAGACATGTHGSGERLGCLATAVTALELVTATGDLVTLSRQADGDRFSGAVVALGSLGIVTRLVLDVVPAFELRQDVYDGLAHERLPEHLDEVLGAGYSVSLFTRWQDQVTYQVWVKGRPGSDAAAPPPGRHWLGATAADGPRHPVPGMPPENCTEQLGVPGPWHERLPHFRLAFTPSSGEELQSEYLLPRRHAVPALDALARIRRQVAPVLQISEVRTVAADDLWLSPCSGRDTVAVHFTWVKDADAVAPVVAAVEEALAPYEPRPHWGKVFGTDPQEVVRAYPAAADFTRLLDEYDPAGIFRNDFVDGFFPRA